MECSFECEMADSDTECNTYLMKTTRCVDLGMKRYQMRFAISQLHVKTSHSVTLLSELVLRTQASEIVLTWLDVFFSQNTDTGNANWETALHRVHALAWVLSFQTFLYAFFYTPKGSWPSLHVTLDLCIFSWSWDRKDQRGHSDLLTNGSWWNGMRDRKSVV